LKKIDPNPLTDHAVVLHYKKGSDILMFRTKERAKKTIDKLKKDIGDLGYTGGFVSITDDDDNTVGGRSEFRGIEK